MPTGKSEELMFAFFVGIIFNPLFSFILSLIIVGPILIFWAVPNLTAWCIICGIVVFCGIRGAMFENKIRREEGDTEANKVRQMILITSAIIWILGIVIANAVK